jgi:transcriptional regulator with XRE-family HTH domain
MQYSIAISTYISYKRLISKGMALPTGNMLRAARALAGLRAAELAFLAKVDPTTISRIENAKQKPVRGQIATIDAVIGALKTKGVEIDADSGVLRLVKKPRR